MKSKIILIVCALLLGACKGSVETYSNGPQGGKTDNEIPNPGNNKVGEIDPDPDEEGPLLGRPVGRRLSPNEASTSVSSIMRELGLISEISAIPLPPLSVRVSFSNRLESGNLTYDQFGGLGRVIFK